MAASGEKGSLSFAEAWEASRYPTSGRLPSKGTTSKDLAVLVDALRLRPVGSGKGRRYLDVYCEVYGDAVRLGRDLWEGSIDLGGIPVDGLDRRVLRLLVAALDHRNVLRLLQPPYREALAGFLGSAFRYRIVYGRDPWEDLSPTIAAASSSGR